MIKFAPVKVKGAKKEDKPSFAVKKPRKHGAPKGRPKPAGSGRKKGSKDKKTVAREETLEEAMKEVFGTLTDSEIGSITPLQILQLCTQAAVRAGNFYLARESARDWAPYVHSKMASVTPDDDPNKAIIIKGGLPDPSKPPETDDAGS